MTQFIRGAVTVNNVRVDIEAHNASEFAEVVKALTKTSAPEKQVTKASSSHIEVSGKKPRARTQVQNYPWNEADVLAIAQMCRAAGSEKKGLSKRVYDYLTRNGVVKARSYPNVDIFTARIWRYIQTGATININKNIMKYLKDGGYEYRPTFVSRGMLDEVEEPVQA